MKPLYDSRPYVRLRAPENSLQRPFTDEEFLAHLNSPEVRNSAAELKTSLTRWTDAAIVAAAGVAGRRS